MLLDRWTTISLIAVIIVLTILFNNALKVSVHVKAPPLPRPTATNFRSPVDQGVDTAVNWAIVPERYAVHKFKRVPDTKGHTLPRIQAIFPTETAQERTTRLTRLAAVKSNFTHAWTGYKTHAWLQDEVRPLSGAASNPFGGWAATLVDSLDTLWILDMRDEFYEAVSVIDLIDFSTTSEDLINIFETTIRHLGGLLSAYDLSGHPKLLSKARQLGDMLYKAFDTQNRMPVLRWRHKDSLKGIPQEIPLISFLAEAGSLSLEFTRLSQLTQDDRYYDASQRIIDALAKQQMKTRIPGLWPTNLDLAEKAFDNHGVFTIGGKADSAYEYLIKQYVLLNGAASQYADMYHKSLDAMKDHLFFQPMTPNNTEILLAGEVHSQLRTSSVRSGLKARSEHLNCFVGGMVLLGAKVLQSADDLEVGKKLTEGCLWIYESMPEGIMPELFHTSPCEDRNACSWNRTAWQHRADLENGPGLESKADQKTIKLDVPQAITSVEDTRYLLRPEAIESVFIQYRITADRTLQDRAWNMFNAIISKTKTDIAHAALVDCTVPSSPKEDRMESFWLAETLKYFYLIFSEPDVISLDQYVFNTEAHPLRRPR